MEHRRPFEWKRANPFGSLKFLTRHPEIGGLALGFFLIYLGSQSVQGNWNFSPFTALAGAKKWWAYHWQLLAYWLAAYRLVLPGL